MNCRLARESVAFYRDADERLDSRVPLGFRACGYLFLAQSEKALEHLRANVALQNDSGVPSRLVATAEAARLVPGLSVETVAGAAWCGEDGYFDRPQSVVEAFARGTDVRIADVRTLERKAGTWRLELGDGDGSRRRTSSSRPQSRRHRCSGLWASTSRSRAKSAFCS